jgi:hypothetical protein
VADTQRIQWAQTISTRDSTMVADAIMYNYYATQNSNGQVLSERRFGIQPAITVAAGAALGLFSFGTHVLEVVGTTFYSDGASSGTVDGSSQYQFTLTGQGGTAVFLKNNAAAYTWNGSVLTQVTDANYPAATVPGVAWLDGYVFVLTPGGILTNSNLNTPATWNALNTINGSLSPDPGACVTRLYNYVASFGTFSATFFYDNGNATGSPLLPNISAVVNVGCAVGTSMVASENNLFWIGQTHQKGRKVYMMNGLAPQPISDEFIEKILNADPLTGVYAYLLEVNGGVFYVLTLTASNCTLAYNAQAGMWSRWSSSALGTAQNAAGASLSDAVITVTLPNHGLNNPLVVKVTSANSAPMFLGTFVANVVDANTITYTQGTGGVGGGINSQTINTFTIDTETGTTSTATGLGQLVITPYVQNFFNPVFYTFANNTDYLLGATNGITYKMQQGVSSDNGVFIYGLLRTNAGDFGSNKEKFFPHIEVIADKVQDTAYVGYSDNDFASFGSFRPVNLGAARSMLKRCAASRRRSFSLLYIGGFQVRFYTLELPNLAEGPL